MHDALVGVYLDAVATSDVIFDATPPTGQHISVKNFRLPTLWKLCQNIPEI